MTCQSLSSSYSFTYLLSSTKVLGNETGDRDPGQRLIGFNSTLGLGSSSSSLSITISGHYGDPLSVGQAVIFTCDQFSFGGILKSILHTENRSGQQTQIEVVDCKEVLARYDLFLTSHADTRAYSATNFTGGGSVTIIFNGPWNGKNVLKTIEGNSWGANIRSTNGIGPGNYSYNLPDIGNCEVFGKGTDYKLALGTITYAQIAEALATEPPNLWGASNTGGPIAFRVGPLLNIAKNEIPYVGTNAKTMTLLDFVNNICEEAGYDWTFHTPGDGIEIRFIDKKQPTTFGVIRNRIEDARANQQNLLSYSVGAEFKNEKTKRVVVGSSVEYVKELYFQTWNQSASTESNGSPHYAALMMGFDWDDRPILAYGPGFAVPIGSENLSQMLALAGFGGFPDQGYINEGEILSTGSLATWKLAGILYPNTISRSLMNFLGLDWYSAYVNITSTFGSDTHTVSMACVEGVKSLSKKSAQSLIFEEIGYNWIKKYVDTWYGKYYMAFIPKQTCYYDITGNIGRTGIFRGSGGGQMLMDEPIDAGWSDRDSDCIGCVDRSMFLDGSGKIQAFCSLEAGDYLSRFGNYFYFDASAYQGDYNYENGKFYTKADIDGRAYNINGDIGVLIKMPNFIPQRYYGPPQANSMGLRMLNLLVGGANGYSVWGGTTDFSYTNIFKETLAAGRMSRIAIPMRNRVMTYGPWNSHSLYDSTPTQGGVEFKIVDDLNPWTYGGYSPMNEAGNRLAFDGIKSRTKYESGSLTLAETPKRNMEGGGASRIDPIIDSIVVKFDTGGATTTYNYKTYVQKFGQSAEAFNAYVKLGVSERRLNQSILNQRNLEMQRGFSAGVRSLGTIRERLYESLNEPGSSSSASLNSVLILSYPDQPGYYGYRVEAGIEKKYGSDYFQDYMNYSSYAVVSLDMLYTPVAVTNYRSNGFMGQMAFSYANSNWPKNKPFPSMPPVNNATATDLQGVGAIYNFHLNPYTTKAMLNNWGDGRGMSYGFNAEYVSYGSDPNVTYRVPVNKFANTDNSADIRGAALRGPLLLQSWGYDTNGKPIPNINDNSMYGQYDNTNIQEQFATNWLSNPQNWPCGPIDLRWDRERCVWVSPPSERLVIAEMIEDLKIDNMARAKLIDPLGNYYPATYTDKYGTPWNYNLESKVIYVYDFLKRPINSGSRIVAYHWGGAADYIPLMIADTYYNKNIGAECCDRPSANPTDPCYGGPDQILEWVSNVNDGIFVEGWYIKNGGPSKVMYDLSTIYGNKLEDAPDNGEVKVLGYTKLNSYGLPCLTGIPIVNCTGEYPDSSGGSGGGICSPGTVWSPTLGRCIGV